jgi:transcription elongation factor GreA
MIDRPGCVYYNKIYYLEFSAAKSGFKKGGVGLAKEILLTQKGLEKLEAELEELKGVKRKEVSEKIKVALSFGDLSENSEYDEAKNEQAIVEARIADIEAMLKRVKVIDESELSNENIHIGSKVELRVTNPATGTSQIVNYKIVGSNEADPLEGSISDESAVGKALLNHKTGDVVEVEVPAGIMKYEVLAISK